MLCPNCKIGVLRIEEPRDNERPHAVCIGCLSAFNLILEYIEGTWFIPISDAVKMQLAHQKATPKPHKDRPDYFTFND